MFEDRGQTINTDITQIDNQEEKVSIREEDEKSTSLEQTRRDLPNITVNNLEKANEQKGQDDPATNYSYPVVELDQNFQRSTKDASL